MIQFGKVFRLAVSVAFAALMAGLYSPDILSQTGERSISGIVTDDATGEPVIGAVLKIDDGAVWAITDLDGKYIFSNLRPGKYLVTTDCLGYVVSTSDVTLEDKALTLNFKLKVSSLALDEVVVTAQKSKSGLNTSTSLGRDALNHLQMSNLTDVAALLPGGKTTNPDLTQSNTFSLREGGSSAGNVAFSTAVEVDGVRVGSNAGFSMDGVDTRSIAVDNVESVEVMTGVPSAEYGDLGSGMVRINTRKGRTPLNMTFTVNPRTYQGSVSKGIGLKGDAGVVNVSAEWARATKKLDSPYESYTRRGLTLGYSNNFKGGLRLETGFTGNIGGMNSEDDPDAFSGEYTRVRANSYRANANLSWMLNRDWITSLKFEASANMADNLSHEHLYSSYASSQPAVHSETEGYYIASKLPLSYFSDRMVDSKELDLAASVKYEWARSKGELKSRLKAGIQWKASGNVGEGEYYEDMSVAANGYRPRPYSQYPFMHNLSFYLEEQATLPLGKTKLDLSAGIREENIYIAGTRYDNMNSWSPRFNAKLRFSDAASVRAGWGLTEKLPSFSVLYPRQEYRDIQTFSVSYGQNTCYAYYTIPYAMEYNPELRWQRNSNSEIGLDLNLGGTSVSLVGYYNLTTLPYQTKNLYTPFSYDIAQLPSGFKAGSDLQVKVDNQTGTTYVRNSDSEVWQEADVKVSDRTFVKTTRQDNGAPIRRTGVELTVDFPEIRPIRTSFRLDGTYVYTYTHDESLNYYYQTGWSHTTEANRSYQYVGVYANGSSGTPVVNGKITHNCDANLTSITHIPEARLIVTLRLEMSLLTRFRNISEYNGEQYVRKTGTEGYTEVWPVAYMDLDGQLHPFTETEAANPEFSNLILKSGNAYTFDQDGYGPYASANLSITKEIGDHVSISFFANNFTNSRTYVRSLATGVGAIFTPSFYYGLSCRLKF